MRIFTVYLEDKDDCYKRLIPAETEEEAREQFAIFGDIVAIKDSTSVNRFDTPELWTILQKAGYNEKKIYLLDMLLKKLGLATE